MGKFPIGQSNWNLLYLFTNYNTNYLRLIGLKKAYWNLDTNIRDIFPNTEPKQKKKKKMNATKLARYKMHIANSKYKHKQKCVNSVTGPGMQAIFSSNFENGAKLSDLGIDTCTSTHTLLTQDIESGMKVGDSALGSSDSKEP